MIERGLAKAAMGTIDACPPSLTDRLRDEKQRLEKRLSEVNDVLAQLERTPETAGILDAVARLGHLNY